MRRFFLVILFTACLFSAAWVWGIQQTRMQLEKTFQDIFQVPVHIQRLTLLPGKITLHHIVMGSGTQRPFLVVRRLQLEGSFFPFISWRQGLRSITVTKLSLLCGGTPMQAQGRLFLGRSRGAVPGLVECEGWLDMDHPFLKGRLELSGTVGHPIIFGWLEGIHGIRKRFVSQFSVHSNRLELSQMEVEGGWALNGSVTREINGVHGSLNVSGPFIKIKVDAEKLSRSEGMLHLWAFVEDHFPVQGTAAWQVTPSTVKLNVDFPKDELMLTGENGKSPPYPVQATLRFFRVDAAELWALFNPQAAAPSCSGHLEGEISVIGTQGHLASEGEIISRDGELLDEKFQLIAIRFQGNGPLIRLKNSELTKSTGVLLLDGEVDLRRTGQPDFFKRVHLSSLEKTLGVAGWQMAPIAGQRIGSSGLHVKKTFDNNKVAVGLRYEEDPQLYKDPVRKEQVEIEYPLSSQESVSMRVEKDETFLGLEHRKKF